MYSMWRAVSLSHVPLCQRKGRPCPMDMTRGRKINCIVRRRERSFPWQICRRVVRIPRSGGDAFAIFVCNSNEALRSACMRDLDMMDVKHIINDYRDEMNLGVSLNLESGTYAVMKYSMRRENNVFAHLSALDFRRDAVDSLAAAKLLGGAPELETYLEIARAGLNVNFSLKGPGIQLAIIAPCGGEA